MEENQEVAEVPAPEPEVTATPEPEVTATPEVPKVFTQDEVDALIGKRLAREQRKWERQQVKPPPAPPPAPEQFETTEAYADALAQQKAEQLLAQREAERQRAELLDQYHAREEDARDKYPDFEQVAYNPRLPITQAMAEAIQASDSGPDIAYYLGSNPKEADRISRLSPLLQAKEIGRLENNLPVKKTTAAPAPIQPVATARSTGTSTYDTTDPRSIKSMSTSEWIEAERQRQIRKLEAQMKLRA
jgi:hypothetical protein